MKRLIVGLSFVVLMTAAAPARADSFAINGVFDWDSDAHSIGTLGLTGGPFGAGAFFSGVLNSWTGPFGSGKTVVLAPELTSLTFEHGSLNGITYDALNPPPAGITTNGDFRFVSSGVMTPTTSHSSPFQTAFTMTGALSIASRSGASLFSGNFTGAGTAGGEMFLEPSGEVFVNTALFRFAGQSESPTPEPASVLLMGAGIIAVVRRFRV